MRYLESCDHESISTYFFPLGLDDINTVEAMIRDKLIGERRLKTLTSRTEKSKPRTGRTSSARDVQGELPRERLPAPVRPPKGGYECSECSNSDESNADVDSEEEWEDEAEKPTAAAGMERTPRGGRPPFKTDRPRENGPPPGSTCAVCGDSRHTADRCWKRCKFCGQAHPVNQCERNKQYLTMLEFLKTLKTEDLPSQVREITKQGN